MVLLGLSPASRAEAAPVCSSVAEFNSAMANNAMSSDDVTLTFDVVGVNPADFHNGKGSLAQMRNTACNGGAQDAVIKVYGTSSPLNTAHPPGTLKTEYGNQCCTGGTCGEHWTDPNASAVVFTDGSEQCNVTMWINPSSVGYKLVCGASTFDGLGGNPEKNVVNQIAVLEYLLPGGGKTWELPNATASNVQVCYKVSGPPVQAVTVPVQEDVTVGPSFATTVFPDVNDLAVEAADTQAYLKFVVPSIQGKITQAHLFMHTRPDASGDGAGGEVHPVANNQWSETTLTWNARPPAAATSLGRIGPAGLDETVSLDLGSAISGPGTYSFAVISPATDTNGTHFFSKEGSATNAAYLKLSYVTVDGDGDGTPDGPDCDDADPAVHPGVAEQCNGHDDNCDGIIDEGCGTSGSGGWGGSAGLGGASGKGGSGVDPNVTNDEEASGCAQSQSPRAPRTGWFLAGLALVLLGAARRQRGLPEDKALDS
jgi:hypothetical protein